MYKIVVSEIETGEEVKSFKPLESLRSAEKLELSVLGKTDLDRFFVSITEEDV